MIQNHVISLMMYMSLLLSSKSSSSSNNNSNNNNNKKKKKKNKKKNKNKNKNKKTNKNQVTLRTLHPNQASFKLQVWISMVGTCQINWELDQAHSTTSWQFFDQNQSGEVLLLAFDKCSIRHFAWGLRFQLTKGKPSRSAKYGQVQTL